MNLKKVVIIIVVLIFIVTFQYLYQKQFGAVSFFLLSFVSFYIAFREWKRH